MVRVGGNGENNKESEETPQHYQTVHAEAGLYPGLSTLLEAEWTGVAKAVSREEEGEERGPWREQGRFCFSSRDLTKLGGGKVCVGLGMKQPMMMRSDQEIPFPRTLGSLKLGGGSECEDRPGSLW